MTTNSPQVKASLDRPSLGQLPFWQRHAMKFLFAALLALGAYDVLGPHGLLAMYRTRRQIRDLQSQVDKLNVQDKQLTEEIRSLKTDPKTIERIAREQMGLARPGEKIFKLPPAAPGSEASSQAH